jgi:hypothetical protein
MPKASDSGTQSGRYRRGAIRAHRPSDRIRFRACPPRYIEQHAVAHGRSSNLSSFFFSEETEQAQANLRRSEERLRQWRQANNIVALESQETKPCC